MGDAEDGFQPSKKRSALREISRDNPGLDDDEEGTSEQEMGTFKRASEDVLAKRRIVKVRRSQASTTPSAPSSNPFAGIRLIPPPGSAAAPTVVPDEIQSGKNQVESVANVDDTNKESDVKDEESERKVEKPNDEAAEEKCTKDGEEEKPESTVCKEKHDGEVDKPEPTVDNEKHDSGVKKPESTADEDKNGSEVGKLESTVDKEKHDSEVDRPESIAEKDKNDGENSECKPEEPDNTDKKDTDAQKAEKEVKKDDGNESIEKRGDAASFSSFQQLSSSQNAFTGFAGTGFSGSTFSFGSATKEGSSSLGSGSIFGLKNDQPSFSFGLTNNGSSVFGASGTPTVTKSEGSGLPSMQEVPVETGEENEKPVFTADSVLFEYLDGAWKERGKGEIKVNISTTGTGKARLVMRTRGNYRLILNASLFPDMKLTNMDKRGVTFACVNSIGDGKDGLSTYALKFKDASRVGEFQACITEHKGNMPVPVALKTPENSPKAADE